MLWLKKHEFDLENPVKQTVGISDREWTGIYTYEKYTCKKCSKTLCLDLWQMKKLPFSMKYGCTK